ncbi:LNS2-domain-containing protein [Linnemannia elongata AG-77]|uniref:phosphatidate phosphatase n=1 Tax=Linnemannia elongata AG-77 TaxID=1314771 RepID=A0A197JQQ7_9FUNG|nr:LNS2-domain-containing protein [Linnemannia elongata AG-77]
MYSVGSFFSTVSKFYSEINPATLSGAIDIVVVQQADGELACSPFHVRFGKLSVLRPQEKVVEVRVNGNVIAFPMKVGDAGEAFFVLETDDYVPDEFATSPIAGPTDESDLTPVDYFDLNGHPHSNDKQKQKQIEGAVNGQYPVGEEDALLDNGYVSAASGHGSAFEESLRDDSDRESIASTSERIMDEPAPKDLFQSMPGSFSQSHGPLQEPESPTPSKSHSNDNQIPLPRDTIDPTVNALFPAVVREELTDTLAPEQKSSRSGRRKSEVLFDMTGYKTDSGTESSDDEDDLPRGILSDSERHNRVLRKRFSRTRPHLNKEQRQQLVEDIKQGAFLKPEETLANTQLERQKSRDQRKKKRAGIPHGSQGRKGRKRANSMPAIGEPDIPFFGIDSLPEKHRDTVAKKDAVAVEKMPKRTARPNVMSDTEMEYETNKPVTSTKEWTWGWGTLPVKQDNPDEDDEVKEDTSKPLIPEEPVEIETREFQMGSTKCRVALSLCGEEEFDKDAVASHKAFQSAQLTFETFSKDPAAVLADKKLVCYIDGRFYSWNNAVPQLAALLFFHQPLSDSVIPGTKDQKPATEDRPSSTRFGTISRWFRKTPAGVSATSTPDLGSTASTLPANETDGVAALESQDPEVRLLNPALRSKSLPPLDTGAEEHAQNHFKGPALSEKDVTAAPDTKRYAKTLRLTSEQLKTLGLKKGANTVSFSVTSSYQGTATCVAKIFLWDHDSQVVISDIDGTITKSDALGHIFAMAGRDWTHLGVAKLFTDIRSNGYHILYLTSRAIGQADYTRKYLQKVEQNSYQLPDGPVIMSPDRLFSAFHREVIIRKPEVFKMACLRDVKKLFGDRNPFYAGFGNRITDALSYRSVNVPPSRIFTIDSYGEVKLELLSAFKSSYLALNDLVNEIFPGQKVAPEFNDWNFWKSDLPKIELPDLPLSTNTYGTSGSSTSLLSSTTSVAKKVASLTHTSSSSSLLQPSSPTSPAVDTKSKQLTYDRTSYTGSFRGRADNWTSDDEHAEQQLQQQLQGQDGQLTEDGSRRVRATSPSMLSAFVPTRLIRAVRSGSTSSAATPLPQSLAPLSPTQLAQVAADESDRPVSIPLPAPVDVVLQTDEEVAKASRKSLDQSNKDHHSSRPNSVNLDDLLPVKQEEDDRLAAGLVPEGVVEEEEEYEGDYEDGEEGEEYGDEEDEDDEFLDDIEEGLEEPFL